MRMQSLAVLAVALVLGGLSAYLARSYLLSQTVASKPHEDRRIVVANQALPFGSELTPENTREIVWPKDTDLPGTFGSRDEMLKGGKRLVLSAIEKNEPILSSKVTQPGQRATLSTLIEDGMRAVTVRVDDVRGVAGFVLPNDRVDVVLTRGEDTRDTSAVADILLQNVKVLAIDQVAAETTDKPVVARAVTLELAAQDAQKVILAQGVGKLSLILNRAGKQAPEPTSRVTISDLTPRAEPAKTGTVTAAPVAPIVQDPSRVVNVVRNGNNRQQYSVLPESR
ncbi:Flp pilus assembly protein CpaB [uncultured Alsobacter sp.]|uniref:Flp pilus assembly protein CpaB n=1 Tax=uncultured Alsobacter sp. TaxID=1748258 RepID=UPI0025E03A97|nr:Flp pilus assembly protein CpaB [uncultured Alsobacter sp.]